MLYPCQFWIYVVPLGNCFHIPTQRNANFLSIDLFCVYLTTWCDSVYFTTSSMFYVTKHTKFVYSKQVNGFRQFLQHRKQTILTNRKQSLFLIISPRMNFTMLVFMVGVSRYLIAVESWSRSHHHRHCHYHRQSNLEDHQLQHRKTP